MEIMNDAKELKATLSGQVAEGLPERFKRTVPKGYKIGHCLEAAANVWIDLPEPIRLALLTGQLKHPLVEMIQQIVDDRIAAGEAAGRALVARQRRKRGPKG